MYQDKADDAKKYGGIFKRSWTGRPIIPKGTAALLRKGAKSKKIRNSQAYKDAKAARDARRAWNKENKVYYRKKKKVAEKPKVQTSNAMTLFPNDPEKRKKYLELAAKEKARRAKARRKRRRVAKGRSPEMKAGLEVFKDKRNK